MNRNLHGIYIWIQKCRTQIIHPVRIHYYNTNFHGFTTLSFLLRMCVYGNHCQQKLNFINFPIRGINAKSGVAHGTSPTHKAWRGHTKIVCVNSKGEIVPVHAMKAYKGTRNTAPYFWLQHWMEVSDKFHTAVALPPPTEQHGWAPDVVWTFGTQEKCIVPARIWTPQPIHYTSMWHNKKLHHYTFLFSAYYNNK
jgi:hypothetical protein